MDLASWLRIVDAFNMMLAFLGALTFVYVQQVPQTIGEVLAVRTEIHNVFIFALLLAVWSAILSSLGFYRSGRLQDIDQQIPRLAAGSAAGAFSVSLLGKYFDIELINIEFLFVFWLVATSSLIFSRVLLKYLLGKWRNTSYGLHHAVIIGTNQRAIRLARRIDSDTKLGIKVVGFVDDEWHGLKNVSSSDYSVVSDYNNFTRYIRNNVVDDVFICAPMASQYAKVQKLLEICGEQGVTVRFDNRIVTPTIGEVYLEQWDDYAWQTVARGRLTVASTIVKRLIDLIGATCALLVLSPVLVGTALAIKLTSPGPAFYVQERVGRGKRRFKMFKFRTMAINADELQAELEAANEADGPVFKIEHDPRIISIGHFLRKTSLDELPQLFNVVLGDMSLVGPRPLPLRDYELFDEDAHRRRFSVQPGITCLWQISGRSGVSFDEWMDLDMRYIDSWSIWLDIKILFKTIPAVFSRNGAY